MAVSLFSRNFFLLVERREHCMPGKRGAFYSHREFADAGKDRQAAVAQ